MSIEQTESGRLIVGRYRLSQPIGEGGMGRVWQGTDELLDRPVAIKELSISPNLPPREIDVLRARMLREARSAAQLSHPSIITVFDVVESDGRPWIVMELVRGDSLGDLLKREGAQAPERVARIGLQVVAALAVAHNRGVVHRDIKPGNVLIARGERAVLTDFGIALLEGNTNLTSTGQLIGSPSYLAPELAEGGSATPASDMWALGVTLYQALEGDLPFQRATPMATLTAIVTEEAPSPVAAGPLRPLLERLLDKVPERRPLAAEAHWMLRVAVDAVTSSDAPQEEQSAASAPEEGAEEPTSTMPVPPVVAATMPPEPPGPLPSAPAASAPSPASERRRKLLPTAAGGAAAVAAIVAGFWLGLSSGDETDPSGEAPPAEDLLEDPENSAEAEPPENAPPLARHEDPTGFSLDVPASWELDQRDNGVFFFNPAGGYLQIDQTDTPADNAKEDWERQERTISRGFSGYQREEIVALDEPYLDEYISAADWEFTFADSNGRMRAVNRAFHNEEKGYALFLVSPEEDWEENRELLDTMTESFEPAE